ncbi:MAG: FAD-dependent oxidoreductase [Phycisphaerae bacterium]
MKIKQVVAKANEIKEGEMKRISVGDQELLLVNVGGSIHAYGPDCPHHGAPLEKGLLDGHRLLCPWHQSVFDARSGRLIDPPTLDDLEEYHVEIVEGNVVVHVPKEVSTARTPRMSRPATEEDARKEHIEGEYKATVFPADRLRSGRTFVIIGSGAAGITAAETLRQEGFQGNITILTQDEDPPYDRTELSKRYLAKEDASSPMLRNMDFYEHYGIKLLLGEKVSEVDVPNRRIVCAGGSDMRADAILLASGSEPRTLEVDGSDLPNVFLLRSFRDCEQIRQRASRSKRAVVVGASFIGMETAASLAQRGIEVTVVAPEKVPFEGVLGEKIGKMYQSVHEQEGTKFRMGEKIQRFEGDQEGVRRAVLQGGRSIDCDMVIVGIGVRPRTDFVKGVEINQDGSLPVDEHLQVADGVFAAGDIARFLDWRTGTPIRIEHWRLAQELGQLAARNMLGQSLTYEGTPFFWTSQHKVILNYVGYIEDWDDIRVEGSIEDRKFVALYVKDGHVYAAAGVGQSKKLCAVSESMRLSKAPSEDDMRHVIRTARPIHQHV